MTQARFGTNDIKIRLARVIDIPKIISLGKNTKEFICSKKAKFYSRDEFENWIKQPNKNIILVVFQKGNFAGFLCAKIMSIHWCSIDTIAIEPKFRNFGIANLLLENLYAILRKKNICYVQALARTKYIGTKKFWKAQGFQGGGKLIWFDRYI